MQENRRLIVVSNRLPFRLRRTDGSWHAEPSPGGLATAMAPLVDRTRALWVGWADTDVEEDGGRQRSPARRASGFQIVPVALPPDVARGYYEGYSNRTLWPLFHGFPSRVEFEPLWWEAYVDANERFRDAILGHLRPDDLVWIHDYHLMLLPGLLRAASPDSRIGFFLHTPFPSSEDFRILPRREDLLRGLLGANYIAFQTYTHLQHFRTSLLRLLGVAGRVDGVSVGGRQVRMEALPIGIAPTTFSQLLRQDAATKRRLAALQKRFVDRRVLLAVDRLDYTKGIPQRLRAYRRLLKDDPNLHRRIVLVQVAVPSREAIPDYELLGRQVNELVGEINGELGGADWAPIIFLRRSIPRSELVALYALADVCWVAPLRDGMNLVAKEYVACRQDDDGVLVLSEFAGAAEEMGEALLVNPYDEERTAETIARALAMGREEQRDRIQALRRRVVRNTVYVWGERFVAGLEQAAQADKEGRPDMARELPVDRVVAEYVDARERLLLLDYDGTLVPIALRPRDAAPQAQLLDLLARLTADPAARVAVVSGRPRDDLDAWLGSVPGLWLFAEHGAIYRKPGEQEWELLTMNLGTDWKPAVGAILERVADRTPGSFVEEKAFSLVWHYRMSNLELGEWQANELVAMLEGMLAHTEVVPVRGKRSVEIRSLGAGKDAVLDWIGASSAWPGFVLAVGDDETDEDLFERLRGERAWTVRVGEGASAAQYRLPGPEAVASLLERLCSAVSASQPAPVGLARSRLKRPVDGPETVA